MWQQYYRRYHIGKTKHQLPFHQHSHLWVKHSPTLKNNRPSTQGKQEREIVGISTEKLLRVVVVLICLTAFTYQTTTLVLFYLSHPTVVNVIHDVSPIVDIPPI